MAIGRRPHRQMPLHRIPRQKFHTRAFRSRARGDRPADVDRWTPINPHEPALAWREDMTTMAPVETPTECPLCVPGSGKPVGHRARHMSKLPTRSASERSESARRAIQTRRAHALQEAKNEQLTQPKTIVVPSYTKPEGETRATEVAELRAENDAIRRELLRVTQELADTRRMLTNMRSMINAALPESPVRKAFVITE